MWETKLLKKVTTALLLVVVCTGAQAAGQFEAKQLELVNAQLFLLVDSAPGMRADQALRAYQKAEFAKNDDNQVSFGFTDDIVWGVLPVTNNGERPATKTIQIDNAWLDEIDVYYFKEGQLIRHELLGDTVPFHQRAHHTRMPAVTHTFAPGLTYVLFRFRSHDPLTMPVYFGPEEAVAAKTMQDAYFYGALYGSLLILLIYNVVLYFYLNEVRYFLYSMYLLAFTTFNFTYTGHGFWLLWPDAIFLQQWLMPALMFCYLLSGVVFTIGFLNTRVFLPSLYASRHKIYLALWGLAGVITVMGSRSFAVMSQLVVLTTLSFWMLLIGVLVYRNGNPLAKFFLPAIALGTGGATVSSLATWGVIPFSQWAFRAIEIGILLEMSLLSIALGFNFKLVEEARRSAETNARMDPLTNLFNRRAFSDLVYPVWELGKRSKTIMSIMLIDLDWFKQINDEFGHAAGDEVLERIAAELKSRLRASDIAVRWGGEEFLVFLPDTELAEAEHLAEVLRASIQTVKVRKSISVTMSIGVASAAPNDLDLDGLIRKADEALYAAKLAGRDRVVVYSEMLANSTRDGA